MEPCAFCTFHKVTREIGTHHVRQQDSAPTQSTYADQSVKRGFYSCTHSARRQWKDQVVQNVLSILFLVSFVTQRVKEQGESSAFAITGLLSSPAVPEKDVMFLYLAPNNVICTYNTT